MDENPTDGTTEHDETDVPLVTERHVGDGPGDVDLEKLPESDFEGFPEPDVQDEDETEDGE